MQKNKSMRLTESAIMLAFATVLSLVKIIDLPYGGSITACSMLPVLIIAYRHGMSWGLFTAGAFSLLQLFTGLNAVSYGTSVASVIAIILLDYIFAFLVLCLGGLFRNTFKSQGTALAVGGLLACVLRYLCHVISGCTVWAGLSIPTQDALLYSIAYNATYMIPETIILLGGAIYISRILDFRGENITRTQPQAKRPDVAVLLSGLSKFFLLAAVTFDVIKIFPALQNEDTGFDITGIHAVDWLSVGISTLIGIVLFLLFALLAKRVPADNKTSLKGLFSAIPFLGVGAAALGAGFFIAGMLSNLTEMTAGDWIQVALIFLAVIGALVLVTVRYLSKKKASH